MTPKQAKDTLIRIERKAKKITGFNAEDWVGIQAAIRHLTEYIDRMEFGMKTLDEAIEDAMPDPNWYIQENNDTSGEEAYNVIQMENMFKSGTTWMKEQILQLLDDRMTSNLANEGNSAGGRYYSAKMEEDIDIITEVKKL